MASVQSLVEELGSPKLCVVLKIKRKTKGRKERKKRKMERRKEERERKAAGGNDLKCL